MNPGRVREKPGSIVLRVQQIVCCSVLPKTCAISVCRES